MLLLAPSRARLLPLLRPGVPGLLGCPSATRGFGLRQAPPWKEKDPTHLGSSKYKVKRIRYPWKEQIVKESWKFLKDEMVQYFESQPARDSTINIRSGVWPKFTMKEELLENGRLPAIITGAGPERRLAMTRADVEAIAFDEPQGHLSYLFKGRLFRIHVENWIEECVVSDVSTDPVEKELYFVRFRRHVPGQMTTLPIPVTLSGLWGCPGYHKGGHVDLGMPTIDCEVVGDSVPPPFVVDVSKLKLEEPYGCIKLRDLAFLLPEDGLTRFSREYTGDEEVITCFNPKNVPEVPLPNEWEDPNFDKRQGKRQQLTYTGFWPRQTTRQ